MRGAGGGADTGGAGRGAGRGAGGGADTGGAGGADTVLVTLLRHLRAAGQGA